MKTLASLFVTLFTICVLSSCAPAGTNIWQDSAVAGAGGAAVGAGTGAAIGSLISNGSVAKSALLGSAVGAGAGIVAGALYSSYSENRQLNEGAQAIKANQAELIAREQDLEKLRKEIYEDASAVRPDPARIEPQYNGQRLGNPFR